MYMFYLNNPLSLSCCLLFKISVFFTRSLLVQNRWTLCSCSTPQSAAPSAWGRRLPSSSSSAPLHPVVQRRFFQVTDSKVKDFWLVQKSFEFLLERCRGFWSSGFSAFSGPIKRLHHSLLSAKIQQAVKSLSPTGAQTSGAWSFRLSYPPCQLLFSIFVLSSFCCCFAKSSLWIKLLWSAAGCLLLLFSPRLQVRLDNVPQLQLVTGGLSSAKPGSF